MSHLVTAMLAAHAVLLYVWTAAILAAREGVLGALQALITPVQVSCSLAGATSFSQQTIWTNYGVALAILLAAIPVVGLTWIADRLRR